MSEFQLKHHPHRRYNPLTREWILVSPQRTQRPWLGRQEDLNFKARPPYDPSCYLCPGNARAGGVRNPEYTGTYAFDNDFAALVPDTPAAEIDRSGLIVAQTERGICRVVCFSPRHDLDMPGMEVPQIRAVIDAWTEQYRALRAVPWVRHVQIFENRGEMMGTSNPHPHCQIWSNITVPAVARKEQAAFARFRKERGSCLLCQYLAVEQGAAERIVFENEDMVVLVPFWAVWPFETMVVTRQHRSSLDQLSDSEKNSLAAVLKRLTIRYDNLFRTPFPYSMGIHQRPTDGRRHSEWHMHAHYYPPLLRSATVRKFMVGYELLANPQRDITAESAAEKLRELPDRHCLEF